jgi:hypothetical protein
MIVSVWMRWISSSRKGLPATSRLRQRLSERLRSSRRGRRRAAATFEPLEGRELLAVPGVDYSLTGFRWADASHITYSIAPDGVFWDHAPNVLNATFDAKFGAGVWERQIARALATWEASANINIGLMGDSFNDLDALGLAQGDTRFGDIRFGGYDFASTTTLAQTYFPPPNGSTAAGDVEINTAMNFAIGSDYDLFSVLLHETGHSLGLDHAADPSDVMYYKYGGVRAGLSPGDIAGIQALYGPRVADSYQKQGLGTGFGSTIDVTGSLNAWGAALFGGVSLATIGDTEYFSVVAPAGASGALHVTAVTTGLSLLSPRVTLFDASGRALDSEGNPSAWGDNVTASVGAVVPGHRYIVAVTGATSDVFAVGSYVLALSFDGASRVATPPARVQTPTPAPTPAPPTVVLPPDRFEPNNNFAQATPLGNVTQVVVTGLWLNTASDVDDFAFRNARAGLYVVNAQGMNLLVIDAFGHVLAQGSGQVALRIARPRTPIFVQVTASAGAPVSSYSLSVASQTPSAASARTRRREITPHVASTPQVRHPLAWSAPWAHGRPALATAHRGS